MLFLTFIQSRTFSPTTSMKPCLLTTKYNNNHEYKLVTVTEENKEKNKYIHVHRFLGILVINMWQHFSFVTGTSIPLTEHN